MIITKDDQVVDLQGKTYRGNILVSGPVSGVLICNGRVKGEIRCRSSGYAKAVERWNRTADWTQAIQEQAPRNITIRDLVIEGSGESHQLYAGPGSTHITARRVTFTGHSKGPSVYLSMETAHNRVIGCTFEATTGARREVMSIDGSADNIVRNNNFNLCTWGGLYIYRNSGENGVIRHQEPRRNLIETNKFNLRGMWLVRLGIDLEIPWGVHIGSRQGRRVRHNDLDAGYPWGSSADDRDFARNNKVINNTFGGDVLNRWVLDSDKGNTVTGNQSA